MKNYMHVKIFILWTLVISTLANESFKILSPNPNPAQSVVSSLVQSQKINKYRSGHDIDLESARRYLRRRPFLLAA